MEKTIMSVTMTQNDLFETISEDDASQISGGIALSLVKIGAIPPATRPPSFGTASVGPNVTAIQINNGTNFDVRSGILYGGFNDVTLGAGESQTFFANQAKGAAGYDFDLGTAGFQLDLKLLDPGHIYEFQLV